MQKIRPSAQPPKDSAWGHQLQVPMIPSSFHLAPHLLNIAMEIHEHPIYYKWWFPNFGIPKIRGFNTKMVYFWMICGTPILGHIHL